MSLKTTILAAALALSFSATPALFAQDSAGTPATQPASGDVSGTYTWEQQGGGGNAMTTTLTLKQEGSKLTGTISGRGGDTPIEEGTVEGNSIKFNVTREFNGNKMVTQYNGTVSGSDLKLSITMTREVQAKKSA
jgi:hypothetical protein